MPIDLDENALGDFRVVKRRGAFLKIIWWKHLLAWTLVWMWKDLSLAFTLTEKDLELGKSKYKNDWGKSSLGFFKWLLGQPYAVWIQSLQKFVLEALIRYVQRYCDGCLTINTNVVYLLADEVNVWVNGE